MKSVRFGVLSTAKIGRQKVIPAMQQGELINVTAIASRNAERAQATAEELGIDNAYGSYEELLEDADVDAVYIPLPNHLHVEWAIKALEAGKHVLCEKPIGLDADDARRLVRAAADHPKLKVMEAFMYRFHPQWQRAYDLVAEGAIGELRAIHSTFSYFNDDPDNVRNQADIGGGALMDIGCYCISLARFLFDREPERVSGDMKIDPDFETDYLTSGVMDFGRGTSTFVCATQLAPHQNVDVFGSEGKITIEIPFNAPPNESTRIRHTRGGETEEITFDATNQYTVQGERFARAVLEDAAVPTPLSDAAANMDVIDAIRRSAERGAWVVV
ncbi:MAG: Gfo/Idh/MocA family oxidoreductase [Rhodothermales bacterium]